MIDESLLYHYHAVKLYIAKGEFVFLEGNKALYYFQIGKGQIKMNNFNEQGREFIQGIFVKGDSFGEPPLFLNKSYPANAVALSNVELIRIKKNDFEKLLLDNPIQNLQILKNLSKRIYYKSLMSNEIASQDAEHRILKLLDYYKESFSHQTGNEDKQWVDLTRQQIADLTGLRVETVIRNIKNLEKKSELLIKKGKVFR